ncbi:hypothetical protein I6F15_07090 [Bradyrhizobium sp. BRP14]|nr:hypothetical protein [Bradyrhizobium sp. BRP14]
MALALCRHNRVIGACENLIGAQRIGFLSKEGSRDVHEPRGCELSLHPDELLMLREIFDAVLVERRWSPNCESANALAARIVDLHRTGMTDADDLLSGTMPNSTTTMSRK